MLTVSGLAFPWVGGVVKEVETEFHQTSLTKTPSQSRVLVVNSGVDDRDTNTTSSVAFLVELVNPGHDVRVVVVSMLWSATPVEAMRGDITADERVMTNARHGLFRLVHFPNGGDFLHPRPRRDLLDNRHLILIVQQSKRATVEESEREIVVKTGVNAVVLEGGEETGRGL
jgi:hypothetical protein